VFLLRRSALPRVRNCDVQALFLAIFATSIVRVLGFRLENSTKDLLRALRFEYRFRASIKTARRLTTLNQPASKCISISEAPRAPM